MTIDDPFFHEIMGICGYRLGSCVFLVLHESGGIMPVTDASLSPEETDRNIRIAAVVLSRAFTRPPKDPPRAS